MPQNVLVSVLGSGEYLAPLIRAVLERAVIPPRNLFLSAKNAAACRAAAGFDVRICDDEQAAVIKSEIVLVTAPAREMATELAMIAGSAQKRVIVTVCDGAQIDLPFAEERVQTATEFIAATLRRGEDGKLYPSYAIAPKTRLFLHQPCRDLVNAMCEMLNGQ